MLTFLFIQTLLSCLTLIFESFCLFALILDIIFLCHRMLIYYTENVKTRDAHSVHMLNCKKINLCDKFERLAKGERCRREITRNRVLV